MSGDAVRVVRLVIIRFDASISVLCRSFMLGVGVPVWLGNLVLGD